MPADNATAIKRNWPCWPSRPESFSPQAAAFQIEALTTATQVVLAQRQAYQRPERAISHQRPETITRHLAHLLLLPRFDLGRPYHLAWVHPLGLGLVAGGGPPTHSFLVSTLQHRYAPKDAPRPQPQSAIPNPYRQTRSP